jgi:hypothetical protein
MALCSCITFSPQSFSHSYLLKCGHLVTDNACGKEGMVVLRAPKEMEYYLKPSSQHN